MKKILGLLNYHSKNILCIICIVIISACKNSPVVVKDPPNKYKYSPPINENYGWKLSNLEAEDLDVAKIEFMINDILEGKFVRIHDIVIARNGKLILDEEFSEANVIRPGVAWLTQRDGSHYIASATKSIVSATVGIAINQGLIGSEQDLLYDHFSEYYDSFENWNEQKSQIKIDNLLTMQAGYKCEDGDGVTMWSDKPDMIKYILDRPIEYEPGTSFHYCSGNTNVLGDLIGLKSGIGFQEFLYKNLFEPMGIERPMYIPHEGTGKPRLGAGIFMQPRDMAKFGQLYLQEGLWNGEQLISKEWIEKTIEPVQSLSGGIYYAHHWWRQDFNINGTTHNMYYAAGNGGQVIYVYPEMELVIVMTGGNYDDNLMFQNRPIIKEYILPAILNY